MNYEEDKSNIKLLSVLAYIGPLFFMGMFAVEKDDHKVKFHTRQGSILFVLVLLSYSLSYLIVKLLSSFPALSEVIGLLLLVFISVGWFVLVIMGVSSAFKGENNCLPIVYDVDKIISKIGS